MQFSSLASGSSGNCYLVSEGDTHILVDAGISCRRIKQSLTALGYAAEQLAAVFITHDHSDHTAALPQLLRKLAVPVFAPPEVAAVLRGMNEAAADYITDLTVGEELVCGEISVRSFKTPHDAAESVGYTFTAGKSALVLATDTGCVTEEMLGSARGSDTAVIEANHDVVMLKNGPYPMHLKKRVLSGCGHLSNEDCGEFAVKLWQSGTKRIILAHLSRENNTPATALRAVGEALMKAGAIPGRDVELCAAPPFEMIGPYTV